MKAWFVFFRTSQTASLWSLRSVSLLIIDRLDSNSWLHLIGSQAAAAIQPFSFWSRTDKFDGDSMQLSCEIMFCGSSNVLSFRWLAVGTQILLSICNRQTAIVLSTTKSATMECIGWFLVRVYKVVNILLFPPINIIIFHCLIYYQEGKLRGCNERARHCTSFYDCLGRSSLCQAHIGGISSSDSPL